MTGRVISIDANGHREVRLLLPWYVTGALHEDERAAVEAHLAQCPECDAQSEAERMLAGDIHDLPLGLDLDPERGWTKMRRLLEQEAAPAPARMRPFGWMAATRSWRLPSGWTGWALAAQACLLLALGGVLLLRPPAPATAQYRVLGAETPSAAVGVEGNVLVIFRPDTREGDMRALVRESGGRVVDGPTEADAYVLAVPGQDRNHRLERLRASANVVMAEPIDSGAAR